MTIRYKHSVDPVSTDGRDIDQSVGILEGEAAGQDASGGPAKHLAQMTDTWHQVPNVNDSDPTYYDHPMLQAPVWEWAIPLYYYIGGLTGASLALGAAAQLTGDERLRGLVWRCRLVGVGGATLSGALLVYDLGKPSRFLNMLRVFRPTSPMNMGAWILSGAGAFATGSLLPGPLGDFSGALAGLFGLGLSTYTGVLIGSSAVPIWQESRKALPALFASSAIASVGCTFDIFNENETQRRITNLFGNIGRVAELTAGFVMEHRSSRIERVGEPFKKGLSGVLWRTAEVLMASSLVVSVLPSQSRRKRVTAGVLGTLGSLVLRYTVEHMGVVSARDARASFHQQRAGHGAAEVTESKARSLA